MYGNSFATACFITRADFTTCGRNILPAPKRSPTMFMPAISGPSITSSGRLAASRASSVSASMKSVMPLTSACAMRLSTGCSRQARSCAFASLPLAAAIALGESEQPLRRVGAAVEHDVLARLAQLRVDRLVDRELAGIDDAHVHAGLDGVIEKDRVHRLAHRLVAAEREREVGDAARNMHMRQFRADAARRLDKGEAVAIVLFDAGRDREDVRVEHDVFRRKADLLGQELVGALADRDLALERVGLALLVEGHHHHRGAVGADEARLRAGIPPRLPSSRSS